VALVAVIVLAAGAAIFGGFVDLQGVTLALSVVAFGTSALLAVTSLVYLLRREGRLHAAAVAAAKAGFLSSTLALLATCARYRTTSGSWWIWEVSGAMLLLLWLCYIGYFLLRSSTEAADRSARFTAAFATIAAVDMPFIYLGIQEFVRGFNRQLDVSGTTRVIDAADLTLIAGVFLSFSAGMFYLYGSERARHERGPTPVSSNVSSE
jgi:hypothetical protein